MDMLGNVAEWVSNGTPSGAPSHMIKPNDYIGMNNGIIQQQLYTYRMSFDELEFEAHGFRCVSPKSPDASSNG
jgi:hypothetical protein